MANYPDLSVIEKEIKKINLNTNTVFANNQDSNQSSGYSWVTSSCSMYNGTFDEDRTDDLTYLSPTNSESYLNEMGAMIVESSEPLKINPKRFVMIDGQHGFLRGGMCENEKALSEFEINQDPTPQLIHKTTDRILEYTQEVAVRYLRPPTPPEPGDIIIQEMASEHPPIAPPIIIRQLPPKIPTPEPIVIREKPPTPPVVDTTRRLIKIPGKSLPPPPRRVIFERLPKIPSKPQTILIERWLPYPPQKRRVIYYKSLPASKKVEKPKNVIIQWDSPKVGVKREYNYLGVIRANPVEYESKYGQTLISKSELPNLIKDIQIPNEFLPPQQDNADREELVGDLEALAMVDLEREGLGHYREYLRQKGFTGHHQPLKTRETLFTKDELLNFAQSTFLDFTKNDHNGRISYSDAARIFTRLDFSLNNRMGNLDLNTFFSILDKDKCGFLSLDEFRQAFLNLYDLYS